jgi:hypothetical protein
MINNNETYEQRLERLRKAVQVMESMTPEQKVIIETQQKEREERVKAQRERQPARNSVEDADRILNTLLLRVEQHINTHPAYRNNPEAQESARNKKAPTRPSSSNNPNRT